MKKLRIIRNEEAKRFARCSCCNYTNNLNLNDETLIETLGLNKKTRTMFYTPDDQIVCEYCSNPDKQFYEVDNKTKTTMTQMGELEKELAKWNNILKQEGFLDI